MVLQHTSRIDFEEFIEMVLCDYRNRPIYVISIAGGFNRYRQFVMKAHRYMGDWDDCLFRMLSLQDPTSFTLNHYTKVFILGEQGNIIPAAVVADAASRDIEFINIVDA